MADLLDQATLIKLIEGGGSSADISAKIVAMLPVLLVVETAQEGYATVKMAEMNLNSDDPDKAKLAFTVVSLTADLNLVTQDRYAILAQQAAPK